MLRVILDVSDVSNIMIFVFVMVLFKKNQILMENNYFSATVINELLKKYRT